MSGLGAIERPAREGERDTPRSDDGDLALRTKRRVSASTSLKGGRKAKVLVGVPFAPALKALFAGPDKTLQSKLERAVAGLTIGDVAPSRVIPNPPLVNHTIRDDETSTSSSISAAHAAARTDGAPPHHASGICLGEGEAVDVSASGRLRGGGVRGGAADTRPGVLGTDDIDNVVEPERECVQESGTSSSPFAFELKLRSRAWRLISSSGARASGRREGEGRGLSQGLMSDSADR